MISHNFKLLYTHTRHYLLSIDCERKTFYSTQNKNSEHYIHVDMIGPSTQTLSNLKSDYGNIAFLLFLYVLQGIPLGLSSAVPLLLQSKKVSYDDQALFSFVSWPFSIKLLWAPIVDSIFWNWMGRRKSWLIPVQLCIGLFMVLLSSYVAELLVVDVARGKQADIQMLTLIFLLWNFLCATQDIVVDGWALTMLSRRNVGYASTCNTVGQTAGFFIGNVIFITLESADFCNKYLRSATAQSSQGIITFESFLYYNGILFIFATALVAIFRGEKAGIVQVDAVEPTIDPNLVMRKRGSEAMNLAQNADPTSDSESEEFRAANTRGLSLKETYSMLYQIMKLPSFHLLAAVLMTCKIGFAAPDAVTGLKLIDAGISQENIALLTVPMVPLQIILPWLISRYTCGPRPLDIFINAYPYRLLFGLVFPLIIMVTPSMKLASGGFPSYYYVALIFIYGLHQVTVFCLYVSLMAFHASISDPAIGGTYMTLLNTLSNLGANWPSTLSLYLVDILTIKSCQTVCKPIPETNLTSKHSNLTGFIKPDMPFSSATNARKLNDSSLDVVCANACETWIDGYHIECLICVIVGFIWFYWGMSKLRRLQQLPSIAWCVSAVNKTR